jgi:hypothetical protein
MVKNWRIPWVSGITGEVLAFAGTRADETGVIAGTRGSLRDITGNGDPVGEAVGCEEPQPA